MAGHKWQKGAPSPNPAGRPKSPLSLTELLHAKLDINELYESMLSRARGEPQCHYIDTATGMPKIAKSKPEGTNVIEWVYPTMKDQQIAWEWLAERYEPMKRVLEMTLSRGPDASNINYKLLTNEQLDQAIDLVDIATGRKPGGALADGSEDEE